MVRVRPWAVFWILSYAIAALGCEAGVAPAAAPPGTASGPSGPISGVATSADGVPIHYASVGTGDAAVVLVHCWSCSSRYWDGTVAALAPRRRVVTLDLAGHGQSGKSRQAWTMAAFGEDVRAVVVALGLRRVILVGHSMGGPVILEAAKLMPDRVVGLVPVDTLHDVEREMADGDREQLFARLRQDFRGTTDGLVRQLFVPTSDKALVDRVVADMTGADPVVAVPALDALFRYHEAAALEQIKVPIVAINTDVRPTHLEANRKHAPQFDVVLMARVGHWPMLERPEDFNAKLGAVVDGMHL